MGGTGSVLAEPGTHRLSTPHFLRPNKIPPRRILDEDLSLSMDEITVGTGLNRDRDEEIPEDFEDFLDDHEKLLEILEDQENFCKEHSAHGIVKTFRCLIMDQDVVLNQVEYENTGNLDDITEEFQSPVQDTNIALNVYKNVIGEMTGKNHPEYMDEEYPRNLEDTVEEFYSPNHSTNIALDEDNNVGEERMPAQNPNSEKMNCMDLEDIKRKGNLDDITEEFHSPTCDIDIALKTRMLKRWIKI